MSKAKQSLAYVPEEGEAPPPPPGPALPPRDDIAAQMLEDEGRALTGLIERASVGEDEARRIAEVATGLVRAVRDERNRTGGVDAFLGEYGLTSQEGVILMCLAESLLRIPDAATADRLIAEKLGSGQWAQHLGHSGSLLVNASTFGLMLTGGIVRLGTAAGGDPASLLKRAVARSGEPVIRQAVRQAMRILGDQFVLGRTIEAAIARAKPLEAKGYRISYDMLGESARTFADAERYVARYRRALEAVGKAAGPLDRPDLDALMARPSISVKLSALHPRFEPGKEFRLAAELTPRLVELAALARAHGLALTIDAEEQDRLDLTLEVFGSALLSPQLAGWPGLGLAVQAYGKRALPVLRWLRRLAGIVRHPIPVRLVKGAYWDTEIKRAQQAGYADYPVFTHKPNTDVSFLAAMRFLFADPQAFYPQLASHNAQTLAAAHTLAGRAPFEFQRLFGMGEALYDAVIGTPTGQGGLGRAARIYAPVGGHEDLLAYLVRRLLENGANTSFVNRIADADAPVSDLIRDPAASAAEEPARFRSQFARPLEIYAPVREASLGLPLCEPAVREPLLDAMWAELANPLAVGPVVGGQLKTDIDRASLVTSPHDRSIRIGSVLASDETDIEAALVAATRAQHGWDRLGGEKRAAILAHAATLIERDRARLMAFIVREAGKTIDAAQGDLREAADFLRYYATEARRLFAGPTELVGPTGERNTLELRGRGVFACISPWNFPLAIYVGQVAGALAAGNAVIAKPAGQTPLTAFLATQLLHEAGVPADVLHLLPGDGSVGARLVEDLRIAGIAFTGSNDTANRIGKALIARGGPIIPFIAETGGINAMIADSSALPEQVIRDAVRSAFDSAGQRCSAARVLFLQDDVAPHMTEMLTGAISALDVGDPFDYATDVGPVIDEAAETLLEAHKLRMGREAKLLIDLPKPARCVHGTYVTPAAYEIERIDVLKREVFGPILHVVRYGRGRLADVIEAINATGFGLTLGLHSRIQGVADYVAEHARVGNLYVNRNQIGAVVGVQPFGGEGLSGTGPKAGGPNYLARFATERVRSTDITATGGNVALLGLGAQNH